MSSKNKSRGKGKNKNKTSVLKYNEQEIHKYGDEYIASIYAEAFYRALKRLQDEELQSKEDEKKETIKEEEPKKGKTKLIIKKIGFILNFIFFPFYIFKKVISGEGIYNTTITFTVSLIMTGLGTILWIFGFLFFIVSCKSFSSENIIPVFLCLCVGIIILYYGSLLIVVGNQFLEEKDSVKIYSFSSNIIAIIGFIISLIALLINCNLI